MLGWQRQSTMLGGKQLLCPGSFTIPLHAHRRTSQGQRPAQEAQFHHTIAAAFRVKNLGG